MIQRPTARRWVAALENLSREIRTCSAAGLHRYYGRLGACPWCELEIREQLIFFVRVTPVEPASSGGFDVSEVWQRILAARATLQPPAPPGLLSASAVTPEPLPRRAWISGIVKQAMSVGILGSVVLLIILRPVAAVLWSVVGYWAWWAVAGRPSALDVERNRRKVALTVAEDKWCALQRKWSDLEADAHLERFMERLGAARAQYEALSAEHVAARHKLVATVRERQLLRFLSRFHVEDVTIANFGPAQVAALVSFGVETAAEVERGRLEKIRGSSALLIDQLLAWRWGLEGLFKFDARDAVAADQKALEHWYAQRYRPLAAMLTEGLEELRRKAALHEHRRHVLLVSARVAATALAQARADMDVF
ncbi:MAG: hypothetical protein HC872_06950 [Gammaproteobacteria bacterium]|nr:hypothetical protein [Gammaproteobacteria bacterium]